MITLITGLPGNGKTLYAISWLKAKAENEFVTAEGKIVPRAKVTFDAKTGEPIGAAPRQVFYSGIADCMVPGWSEADPERWMDLPAGSIILIDEVQRIMRPRQHGTKVPEFVAQLETHRHKGVDLVLITQHPMLLDSNARRLTGQHFHVMRKGGTHLAIIHEWAACKEQCMVNREDSHKHTFTFPKETFALYKSAELHTHKRRIPARLLLLLAVPVVLVAIAVVLFMRFSGSKATAPAAATAAASSPTLAPSPALRRLETIEAKASVPEYLAAHQPRVEGLAYTAPLYDEITKPVQAPYPAACVVMKDACRCFSQQGTRLVVPATLCRSIVDGGFFVAWEPKPEKVPPREPDYRSVRDAEPTPTGPVIIGRSKPPEQPSPSILDRDPSQPGGRGKALPPPGTPTPQT